MDFLKKVVGFIKTNYQKQWFMWVSLIFFCPLGIFLMFKYNQKFSKRTKIIIAVIAVIFIIGVLASGEPEVSETPDNNSSTQQTTQTESETDKKEDENFFTADKDQKDTDSIKKDFGIETTDKLRELGFTVEEATSIYNIFVKIGVNQISDVQKGAGTGIDNLQSFVAIANNDKQLKFYFTVENRQLYYAGFRDAALYDSTEGGVLKNIGDVHIPKTDVDANTYSQLQVMSQNIVKQYLKYPNTAKFPWLDGWGVGRSDDNYRISGKVTAKNGFGVESEMTFSVYFLKTNDTFTVEAVVIDGQRVK